MLVAELRRRGETVAVIAVDPSSRRTGGALLGDRARIEADPDDAGVFIRSMAARRRLGGLAELTFPAVVLLRAGFDRVLVETVGVGQSETEIADCADLVVLCVQPASGDGLQFIKAGVMETPDLVLVTKADLGAPARRAAADVRGALSIAGDRPPRFRWCRRIRATASRRRWTGSRHCSTGRISAPRSRSGADRKAASGPSRGLPNRSDSSDSPRWRRRLDAPGPPFRSVLTLIEKARAALHENIKNI